MLSVCDCRRVGGAICCVPIEFALCLACYVVRGTSQVLALFVDYALGEQHRHLRRQTEV